MNSYGVSPSRKARSGRQRGVMGAVLALLMLLPTLAISSASAAPDKAPSSAAARQVGKFGVRATYFWPGTSNGRQMSAGQEIDWRGYVSPYVSTSRVVIQYKVGSRWYDGAKAKPYGSGYFRVRQKFTTPGVKTIRLRVYSGTGSYNTWTGNPIQITVYAWKYLTDLDQITGSYYSYDRGASTIDGTTYGLSIRSGGIDRYAEWNLSRRCTTFQFTAGQEDNSTDTDGIGGMRVKGDSVYLRQFQTRHGQKYARTVNISGYLRLRIEGQRVDTDRNYIPVWGNPRIRCSF